MTDWKHRCLEFAEIVNRHRKDWMHKDMKLGWKMAQDLIELGKREEKARLKFMEHWRCPDKKESEKLYAEYLELIG